MTTTLSKTEKPTKTMTFIPQNLYRYFWDVNPQTLAKKHKKQIIARLLDYGDTEAIGWCKEQFSEKEITECLKTSRGLSKKSANFWAIIFDIPKNQVLCLQPSFREIHRKLWNY